uniref:Uncharacterized protein n=1 Tax=Arundo donax TaxID=35708 RepID=A0A0A8Z0B4_ARUDO
MPFWTSALSSTGSFDRHLNEYVSTKL